MEREDRSSCIIFWKRGRAAPAQGPSRRGAGDARRPEARKATENSGRRPKGKDFGQWARVWNRQVARGAGLRYTRAKDLVKNRSTVAVLALPDVGAERILFF